MLLDRITTAIDYRRDVPVTILEDCSAEFREYFSRADLIVVKAHGDFETLREVPANIAFF